MNLNSLRSDSLESLIEEEKLVTHKGIAEGIKAGVHSMLAGGNWEEETVILRTLLDQKLSQFALKVARGTIEAVTPESLVDGLSQYPDGFNDCRDEIIKRGEAFLAGRNAGEERAE